MIFTFGCVCKFFIAWRDLILRLTLQFLMLDEDHVFASMFFQLFIFGVETFRSILLVSIWGIIN